MTCSLAGDIKGTVLVDAEEIMPGFPSHVGEASLVHHEAGIGYRAIDPAHLVNRFCKGCNHTVFVGNVHFLSKHFDAKVFAQFLGSNFVAILAAPPDNQIASGAGDPSGETQPDSGIAARDQHYLSGQIQRILRHARSPQYQ